MRLNELLKPGEGPAYQWGDKFALATDGKFVVSGDHQGDSKQYFVTEDNKVYAINFDRVNNPSSTSLSFGNLIITNSDSGYINYGDLRKLPIKQAAKVLNTVVSAATAYSAANGGVPLWTFNTNSQKKARVYKMIASRIAEKIKETIKNSGFRYFKDPWSDYLFAVFAGEQGEADLQKYVDSVNEFGGVVENPSDI